MIKVRPITQSQLNTLGTSIVSEDWSSVKCENNTDDKLATFTKTVFALLDTIAPTKEIKISCDDPAWMNTRIKTFIRKRNREFHKHGKSDKWKCLKTKCKSFVKKAKAHFTAT